MSRHFPASNNKVNCLGSLEPALMADGVPRNKLYPLDVDRALKKLSELKPHIRSIGKQEDKPADH